MGTHVHYNDKDLNYISGLLKEKYPEIKVKNKKTNIIIRNKVIILVIRKGRETFKISGGLNFSYLPLIILLICGIILGAIPLAIILLILELSFRPKIKRFQREIANVL